MAHSLPPHVHRKTAKGRTYLYFDTGRKTDAGKPIRVALPAFGEPGFWTAYNACQRDRDGTALESVLMVPALCDAFRKSPRFKGRAANTRRSYEIYLRVIEQQLDTFPAADVEPKDVAALQAKLSEKPAAANQCVRVLSAMYAWGKSPAVGLVRHNPASGAELYAGGEHEPWPEWLLEAALEADDLFIRLVVNLLYFSGQRIGDACAMPWRKIGADHDYMEVKQEKTGEELEIRIHARLRTVLRLFSRSLGTVIARPDGAHYSTLHVRNRIKAWAAERGVDVVPHGLRKNAVNGLLEAGCSAAEVSAITGQSLQMVEHYARKRDRKKLSGSAVRKWEMSP